MLSFIQQRLGKTPTQAQTKMTRQESIESAFSRVAARNDSKDPSTTPSLTTATSLTDTSSELTDGSAKADDYKRSSARSRASIGSYNENVLSAKQSRSARKQGAHGGKCTISGQTLVDGDEITSRERLLQQSVQALDEDWKIGAMPGDNLRLSTSNEDGAKRRRSMRLDILDRASSMIEKTTTVLGKRGRETVEAGMGTIQASKSDNKTPSLRPREPETPCFEGPSRKRARFLEVEISNKQSAEPGEGGYEVTKKPTKPWVAQGLYVGQHRSDDARLTETKNKEKKTLNNQPEADERAIMPMPMWLGDKIIETGRDFKLPFNVFSPLPPGQPKPDEWKKTQKNVFIGDAANVWKKAKDLEHSTCICTAEAGCDDHCFNRFMLYECDDSNCKVGAEHCTNRSFAALKQRCKVGGKYNIGVEVMKTADRGYGIRANRTFEPNQIIVEYTGEIITQSECDERMNKRYKDAECYYLMDFDQSMILDATRGSIARFVNHSCAPNCRMIKWTVAGKPRMALFAGDNGIMTGEELTYDYNFNPYSVKNVQECRCGAEGCRGVLGPKPKEIREALKPITTGRKRKIQQVVEDAVETVTKRRKIAVPSSVKSAFAAAKAQTSRRLSQAGVLGSSATQNRQLVKKVSQRSLRGLEQETTTERLGDGKKRQRTTITYSRRRSSVGTLTDTKSEDKIRRGSSAKVAEEDKGEKPFSRGDSVKVKVASMKEGVVRTVRRSSRGTPAGKTIRIIGDDEYKGWR
ncbi:hypothetical protein HO133_000994 [Letharia lupina]|uniref:Uncharacterized protein n=1 Tax=Letharia lupina TaxID=560253 RepID=A0A8H6CG44_9LECA|nr:uncharacterized protein HO133_000994 [Letharia lupina]KAF6222943.1 hypothetical protein HO133_000994 [Letharia lupina]